MALPWLSEIDMSADDSTSLPAMPRRGRRASVCSGLVTIREEVPTYGKKKPNPKLLLQQLREQYSKPRGLAADIDFSKLNNKTLIERLREMKSAEKEEVVPQQILGPVGRRRTPTQKEDHAFDKASSMIAFQSPPKSPIGLDKNPMKLHRSRSFYDLNAGSQGSPRRSPSPIKLQLPVGKKLAAGRASSPSTPRGDDTPQMPVGRRLAGDRIGTPRPVGSSLEAQSVGTVGRRRAGGPATPRSLLQEPLKQLTQMRRASVSHCISMRTSQDDTAEVTRSNSLNPEDAVTLEAIRNIIKKSNLMSRRNSKSDPSIGTSEHALYHSNNSLSKPATGGSSGLTSAAPILNTTPPVPTPRTSVTTRPKTASGADETPEAGVGAPATPRFSSVLSAEAQMALMDTYEEKIDLSLGSHMSQKLALVPENSNNSTQSITKVESERNELIQNAIDILDCLKEVKGKMPSHKRMVMKELELWRENKLS